jgi:hypothetical protein
MAAGPLLKQKHGSTGSQSINYGFCMKASGAYYYTTAWELLKQLSCWEIIRQKHKTPDLRVLTRNMNIVLYFIHF